MTVWLISVQNVVGNFLLGGQNTIPFIYHVQKISESRSFSTRIVNVTQGESKDICFTGMVFFKTAETSRLDLQEQVNLWERYKIVLEGKRPRDFDECPGMDVPWYWKYREETGQNDQFPGLETNKVDMTEFNKDKHPLDRRALQFYRTLGQLPPNPNLHLVAHLYASDRNSLYIVSNHLDAGDLYTQMSSLVHTTVFHSPVEDLMFGPSDANMAPMDDTRGDGRWFGKEDWTTRSSNGRAMFHGRLWAPDGTQIATLMQDGMIRYTKKPEPTSEELGTLKDRERGWKPRGKL